MVAEVTLELLQTLMLESLDQHAATRREIADIRRDVADMSERLTRMEGGQADMSERLTRMEVAQDKLRTDFLEELGSTRAAVMGTVEGLQDSVTAIRGDIAVNFGAVDQARRVNDNTRDEMRVLNDVVARMMTLILRLQTEVAELKGKPAP